MKPNIENSPFRLQRNQLKIPDSPSFGYSTIPRSAGVSPLAQRYLLLHLEISIAFYRNSPHWTGNSSPTPRTTKQSETSPIWLPLQPTSREPLIKTPSEEAGLTRHRLKPRERGSSSWKAVSSLCLMRVNNKTVITSRQSNVSTKKVEKRKRKFNTREKQS